MLDRVDQSNAGTAWRVPAAGGVVGLPALLVEVDIPEAEVELARRSESGEDNVPSTRRPEDTVASLTIERSELDEVALARVELVEADSGLQGAGSDLAGEIGVAGGNQSESVSLRLPRESGNGVLDLDNLDWNGLLPNSEHFEIAVGCLLRLRQAIDLDAEVVSAVLPVELALCMYE